jgi:type II secretory pathway pseudopilin PulG
MERAIRAGRRTLGKLRRTAYVGGLRSQGFTYLGVLIALAAIGLSLGAAAEVWSTTARRQRLAQLEFVGGQFVQAIGSYYESSPDGLPRYPPNLEELLADRRFPGVRRHLRRIYLNPFTGSADWELLPARSGGVRGVAITVPSTMQRVEFTYTPKIN